MRGPGYAALPEFLQPFQERLLIQCMAAQALEVAPLTDRDHGGLVITAQKGNGSQAAAQARVYSAARHLKEMRGYGQPMLLDAGRYSGASRALATDPFDPAWEARQRELGLVPLTDSGYVGEGDAEGLDHILHRTALLGDAIALLPLNLSWLRQPAALQQLIDKIEQVGVPVALVLEYASDPLGLVGVAAAVMRLVNCRVPVMLLRCDLSALGALCVGAVAAAVGTTTGLRHLYPQTEGGGGPTSEPNIAAVVKECLAFLSVEKIALAAQADPDDPMWQCSCGSCLTRPLSDLIMEPVREEQERRAFMHSLEVVLDLRDELLAFGSTWAQRAESWRSRCQQAQCRHHEVESTTDKWDPPSFLGRWQTALTTLVLQERVR